MIPLEMMEQGAPVNAITKLGHVIQEVLLLTDKDDLPAAQERLLRAFTHLRAVSEEQRRWLETEYTASRAYDALAVLAQQKDRFLRDNPDAVWPSTEDSGDFLALLYVGRGLVQFGHLVAFRYLNSWPCDDKSPGRPVGWTSPPHPKETP